MVCCTIKISYVIVCMTLLKQQKIQTFQFLYELQRSLCKFQKYKKINKTGQGIAIYITVRVPLPSEDCSIAHHTSFAFCSRTRLILFFLVYVFSFLVETQYKRRKRLCQFYRKIYEKHNLNKILFKILLISLFC